MRGLVPKFIMLIICLLHINYRPFDPCERVLTQANRLAAKHPDCNIMLIKY